MSRTFRVVIQELGSEPQLRQVTDVVATGVVCMMEAAPGEWMLSLRGVDEEQVGRALAAAFDQLHNLNPQFTEVAIEHIGRSRPGVLVDYAALRRPPG